MMSQKDAVFTATLTVLSKYGFEDKLNEISATNLISDRKEEVYKELEKMLSSKLWACSIALEESLRLNKYLKSLVAGFWIKDNRLNTKNFKAREIRS